MKILLDTQALILAGRDELPPLASRAFCLSSNQVYFSLVSLWEIGIKTSLGKLHFPHQMTQYHKMLINTLGMNELSILPEHIEKSVSLPFHHRDPFDRLIISQALVEDFTLMGSDQIFSHYGCKLIWD
jgi:PIN domain nuclease of toxin-antitoxin system